jgi:hypothetical protein
MGYLYSICLKLFVQVSIPVRSESGPDILVLIRDSLLSLVPTRDGPGFLVCAG